MHPIRQPAVAGYFYPDAGGDLRGAIESYLAGAAGQPGPPPKALIAPHAGYLYSGAIAASAYARLRPHAGRYTRVVLLGPCHRVPLRGLATSGATAFRTPLGDVPLDRAAIATLDPAQVAQIEEAHNREHSLEVHLPFLQIVLAEFSLVPLVVGQAKPGQVAGVLAALWGGAETLVVVSSDLSHYLPYEEARSRDRATCEAIEAFDPGRIGHGEACGAVPVGGLLIEARRRQLGIETLDLRNSGDTAGGRDSVVGYGAWALS